jgi:hypothetical protein
MKHGIRDRRRDADKTDLADALEACFVTNCVLAV